MSVGRRGVSAPFPAQEWLSNSSARFSRASWGFAIASASSTRKIRPQRLQLERKGTPYASSITVSLRSSINGLCRKRLRKAFDAPRRSQARLGAVSVVRMTNGIATLDSQQASTCASTVDNEGQWDWLQRKKRDVQTVRWQRSDPAQGSIAAAQDKTADRKLRSAKVSRH